MARGRNKYRPKQRETILDVVEMSRNTGRNWKETHRLAQKAGYRGSLPALMVFVGDIGKKTVRRSKTPPIDLHKINGIIDREVKKRTSAIVSVVIEELKKLL